MESVLNGFYLVMAGYGWFMWNRGRSNGEKKPVVVWAAGDASKSAIAAITALSIFNGFLLSKYSDAAFPYIDSMTTWFAIWSTFLIAQKST